jgi:hypothetical protein
LITYSTGASISFNDRADVESILQKTKPHDYSIRDLIHAVVNSPLFLCK